MGFLIRATFWFSLVLLALPLSSGPDGDNGPSVGPLEALVAAREAVGDIVGLCERQPDVCTVGKSAMQTITARARETVRIAAALLEDDAASSTVTAIAKEALPDNTDAKLVTGSVPAKN